ncbi:helix-turn-helix transcriptional regulator [Nocardia sp. alder85J]|uniref:helix-turn-helix transcriptional regulator n=1 Tax=Nocardia sp. alder85J TaxID=2862949 RepID=UPI001CD1C964|nr:AraC family transcriptional regulator [Nocardia sp. alder85J]MCX4097468.1 AraC family transcriptional regulator [Nocardia sp. alder85J]
MTEVSRVVRHHRGVPVHDYPVDPVTPPVLVMRPDPGRFPDVRPHIHDFPALWYRRQPGVVYVVAAGAVVDAGAVHAADQGAGVFFDPVILGGAGRMPWPSWRAHPLLFPFLHGRPGGLLCLEIPPSRLDFWDRTVDAIEAEIRQRGAGYREASTAYLTLLLVDLARLAADVVGDLRRSGEPLLAEVFEVIDRRFAEPLSLRDVARAVGLTPGHLATVVRRRTGRTVLDWIAERRMTEARRLLAESDLPVGEVARRVGIADPGYFTRLFRRGHGMSPRQFRGGQGSRALSAAEI